MADLSAGGPLISDGEGQMDRKFASDASQSIGKRKLRKTATWRLANGAPSIVVMLSSLWLWAALWSAVATLR